MLLLGNTPLAKKKNSEKIAKLLSKTNVAFASALILPFLIFIFFNYFYPQKGLPTQDIKKSIVRIESTDSSCGTGFLVSPTKILTARHIVENMKIGEPVKVFFEQGKSGAKEKEIVGRVLFFIQPADAASIKYFANDFAVIEIPQTSGVSPLAVGSSSQITEGESIIVAGYSYCQGYSRTDNTINSLDYNGEKSLFKHNADVNPGNSGGPLIRKSNNTAIAIVVARPGDPRTQGGNAALKMDEVVALCRANGIDLIK